MFTYFIFFSLIYSGVGITEEWWSRYEHWGGFSPSSYSWPLVWSRGRWSRVRWMTLSRHCGWGWFGLRRGALSRGVRLGVRWWWGNVDLGLYLWLQLGRWCRGPGLINWHLIIVMRIKHSCLVFTGGGDHSARGLTWGWSTQSENLHNYAYYKHNYKFIHYSVQLSIIINVLHTGFHIKMNHMDNDLEEYNIWSQ